MLPDHTLVEKAVRDQDVVLVFELWGSRNAHLIQYNVPLALTLHTAIRHKKPVSFRRLADIATRYGFDLVESLEVTKPDFAGLAQAYRRWQEKMGSQNQAAGEDVFVQEGAILALSTKDTATYWKVKPPSIEEIHWTAGQNISKEIIQQALHKMLENGHDFMEGNVEAVYDVLEADFTCEAIEWEAELVQCIFQDFVLDLQQKEWLHKLVDESGLDPRDHPNMMRYISQHYTKRQMGWVYAVVKQMYGE